MMLNSCPCLCSPVFPPMTSSPPRLTTLRLVTHRFCSSFRFAPQSFALFGALCGRAPCAGQFSKKTRNQSIELLTRDDDEEEDAEEGAASAAAVAAGLASPEPPSAKGVVQVEEDELTPAEAAAAAAAAARNIKSQNSGTGAGRASGGALAAGMSFSVQINAKMPPFAQLPEGTVLQDFGPLPKGPVTPETAAHIIEVYRQGGKVRPVPLVGRWREAGVRE